MNFCWIVWFLATTYSLAFQPFSPPTKYKRSIAPVTDCNLSSAVIKRGGHVMLRNKTRMRLHAETPSFPDRFSRWRFMQHFLDGDVDNAVINAILFSVLQDYLQTLPMKYSPNEKNGSAIFTPELTFKLEEALAFSAGEKMIEIFSEESNDEELLKKLENLLPDPQEDEDAHKSAWDILMEIHGHELVKSNEHDPTPEWRKLCLVARLLIHYDFITRSDD